MKRTRFILVAVSLLFALTANAQTQVPNDFQAGTPARAAEVNENFDALESAVDSNALGISTNISDIASSENDIQSLGASMEALTSGGTGLSVLFYNPILNATNCQFVHIPANKRIFWNGGASQQIIVGDLSGGNSFFTLLNIATIEESKVALLDLMIRIGDLPLVVEDFRDPATGEFDCSNEKLLSLL